MEFKDPPLSLFERFLIAFFPKGFLRHVAKLKGVDKRVDAAYKLFRQKDRVDLFPFGSGEGRSLILVLNKELALFFEQEGDHFMFDGFEMGKYIPGDVSVFDDLHTSPFPE